MVPMRLSDFDYLRRLLLCFYKFRSLCLKSIMCNFSVYKNQLVKVFQAWKPFWDLQQSQVVTVRPSTFCFTWLSCFLCKISWSITIAPRFWWISFGSFMLCWLLFGSFCVQNLFSAASSVCCCLLRLNMLLATDMSGIVNIRESQENETLKKFCFKNSCSLIKCSFILQHLYLQAVEDSVLH